MQEAQIETNVVSHNGRIPDKGFQLMGNIPYTRCLTNHGIVNAGIGKGAVLGSGKLWANKATIETNLVAALVRIVEQRRRRRR